jgi:hypothetical protein
MAAVDPHESLPTLPGGATLEADGGTWLLRYSVQSYDYGERLPDMVDSRYRSSHGTTKMRWRWRG